MRFSLKHLVLEVIGQIEDVDGALADYCIRLLGDDYWRPHVLDTVFLGHAPYVRLLAERGVISRWLKSTEQETILQALKLLESVGDKLPDLVAELLAPFAENSKDWAERVLRTIGWGVASDSDKIFELRLQLARRGFLHDIVDWPTLCRKHPLRALRLIDAYVSTWVVPKDPSPPSEHRGRLDRLSPQAVAAVSEVGRAYPPATWDLLMPHVLRLTGSDEPPGSAIPSEWRKSRMDRLAVGEVHLARALVEMVVEAGQRLARENPALLLKGSKAYEESGSPLVQQILMEVYSHLSAAYADAGLEWLLRDVRRLSLGDGETEPVWMPAVRIVRALSPHCTADAFDRLEQALIHYRDPYERRLAKHRLGSRRIGCFTPYWGREQYFLLPALCAERRSRLTNSLIDLLEQQFKAYPERSFLRGCISGGGGFVGSKLHQHLDRISDKSWLAILANKQIPYENRGDWVQIDEDHVVESSVWQFSRSLGTIAKRFPERFGRLALQFPPDTHRAYVSAILEALRLTKPDPAAQAEEGADWEPASPTTVMAVLERFHDMDDREAATAFCWVLRSRPEEEWPISAVDRVLSYAQKHADPEPGKLVVHCDKSSDEATVDMLFQNTLNCVRGVAAGAIGQLLWHHPDWLGALQAGITSVVNDPHPAVRMAAIEALLPVLNINREQAINWFCEACRQDARIPASPRGIQFLNHTIRQHPQQLGPLVRAMVRSRNPEVAHQGAQAVAAYWLFHGLFAEELTSIVGRCRVIGLDRLTTQGGLVGRILARCLLAMPASICRRRTTPQRAGVARIAASRISEDQYAARCRALLAPCLNDPAKDVRDATSLMWTDEFLGPAENVALARIYVQSLAFADNPSWALHCLEEHGSSLIPLSDVVFEVCKTLTTTLLRTARDSPSLWHGARAILLLLLRLYEQTQEQRLEIARRCLDTWDVLLEKRVGIARELTRAIDR